jgi:hypothetical protein
MLYYLKTNEKNCSPSQMKYNSMKSFLFTILGAFLLVGCGTNRYEEHYSVISVGDYTSSKEQPKLIEIANKKQLNSLKNNGNYILIGKSDFFDIYTPRTLAIDCAKKHGASLVALELGKGEIIEYDAIKHVSTTSTTYFYGDIQGTATTYGSTPVVVKEHMLCYPQTAYFFAKREFSNSFGVSFQLPENIPGNKDKTVRVLAVQKGSQAEKSGIKKNDIVKSINGETISSPDDVIPYIKGTKIIKTIKVSHE